MFGTGVPLGDTQVGVPALISIRPLVCLVGSSSLVRLWYLHRIDKLSIFVNPPRDQAVTW